MIEKKEYSKKDYLKHRQKRIASAKQWAKNNPDKVQAIVKRYRDKKGAEVSLRYRERNRENARAIEHRYRSKYHTDPNIKMKMLLRSRLLSALKGQNKSASTIELIGCSIKECRTHLESLFQPGMTWENQGQWHIDHKLPCDSFDLSKPDQQRKCFHYTNLQPLWAKDNQIKKNKILYETR